MIEVEWQFEADDLDAVERWLRALPAGAVAVVPQGEQAQRDEYLDSADWRVWRAGFALRVRRRGEMAEATLKALAVSPGIGPSTREEVNEPLPAGGDPRTGDGPVAARLRGMPGAAALRSLCVVTTRRRTFAIEVEGIVVATLALDDTQVGSTSMPAQASLSRVEVEEEAAGGLLLAGRFVEELRVACGLTPAQASKFESALAVLGIVPPGR